MKVLLVGSGGREHALAWKIAQSPRLSRLWIAPGNPGTARLGENVPLAADDVPGLVELCPPERRRPGGGRPGSRPGSRAERRPGGSRDRRLWPLPGRGRDRDLQGLRQAVHAAPRHPHRPLCGLHRAAKPPCSTWNAVDYPVVIKASGLAAGQGRPAAREPGRGPRRPGRACWWSAALGSAGDEVVIEERLAGEEVSLLAFSDGLTVARHAAGPGP